LTFECFQSQKFQISCCLQIREYWKQMSRASIIAENLQSIKEKVLKATERRAAAGAQPVRLVAVSKTKPLEDVMHCYQQGHRVFGENYVCVLAYFDHE
jgi:hypothetical protein